MSIRGAGIAGWSIQHPVGVTMIALAVMVLGLFALGRLRIDLLPHIIYPEISVRVLQPGVPARIMEDRVTRQLEEQLAITEHAVAVQSRTSEGRSAVDLSFPYGTDMDRALRDASTRLDRARRFLPQGIDPPIIYKRDPSQRPVLELVVSSRQRPIADLRDWVDYRFGKWFLNLPGVAATEVGGAPRHEWLVSLTQEALAGNRLGVADVLARLRSANADHAAGRLDTPSRELGSALRGRFERPEQLRRLPLPVGEGLSLPLERIATVLATTEPDRLRIRLDGDRGVKLSIQKQPEANTVAVADAVRQRLGWLQGQRLIPDDVEITVVGDQSRHVRLSLRNAAWAAVGGAALAMTVVWLFLGDLRRSLIIGSVIPMAILVTFVIMAASGLSLNLMTLGGLALGIGLLVDNTIVMMENIGRHQQQAGKGTPAQSALRAAAEVFSPIVAATATNLAAILPFLFIGGLVGLLFRELVLTLSAAVLASLVVAVTLVPAWGARRTQGASRALADRPLHALQHWHARLLDAVLRHPAWTLLPFLLALALALWALDHQRRSFLPATDEGRVWINLTADPGTPLDDTDTAIRRIENLLGDDPRVAHVFSTIGGFVFGRSEYRSGNRASISVALHPAADGRYHTAEWSRKLRGRIKALNLAGYRVRVRPARLRGVRTGRGDDDLSIRIQGPDLDVLARLGDAVVQRLEGLPGLRNLQHSYEARQMQLAIVPIQARIAELGFDPARIADSIRAALDGVVAGDLLQGDRSVPIRLRLSRSDRSPEQLATLVVATDGDGHPITLGSLARISLQPEPAQIVRDQQQRIVEISASIAADTDREALQRAIDRRLADLELPAGYVCYDGGSLATLRAGQRTGLWLALLALFLVFVVMAVQYESLRNPLVILLTAPFALIGVAGALWLLEVPLSMPVWLGLIILVGVVVNNAIVLVEQTQRLRAEGLDRDRAIRRAAQQRLRPILMTTLTTVLGMLPLALGLGEGSELLQPLALVIVFGLGFSLLVTPLLAPLFYHLLHGAKHAMSHPPEPERPRP